MDGMVCMHTRAHTHTCPKSVGSPPLEVILEHLQKGPELLERLLKKVGEEAPGLGDFLV